MITLDELESIKETIDEEKRRELHCNKISLDEMQLLFGDTMPIEAVSLISDNPDNLDLAELRVELMKIKRNEL